jgi:hypothetical protein
MRTDSPGDPLSGYPTMMTPSDVADFVQVSEGRLATWRGKQVGPPWVKVGDGPNGAVRYPREELRAYIENRTVRPAAAPAVAS